MTRTIAIDFDGVIANSDYAKARFARLKLGLDLNKESMKRRCFIELYGKDRGNSLYSEVIHNIYHTERMLNDVPLMSFARESIDQLRTLGWRCVVVTSRSGSAEDRNSSAGLAWRFLTLFGLEVERADFFNVSNESKLEVCLQTDAHGLVDDDYSKLLPVIEAGKIGYLFSSSANREAEIEYTRFRGTRVADWRHLVETLSDL